MTDAYENEDIIRPEEDLRYRRRWVRFLIGGLIVVAAAAWIVLRPARDALRPAQADVAATVFPLYDITRNVAGDAIDVALVLPPGASPHTFEASPRLRASLDGVQALYMIGHGLDEWAARLLSEDVDRIVVDEGIAIIDVEDRHREGHDLGDADHDEEDDEHEDEEEDHAHGDTDPHYWLTIPNGKVIARNIARDLSERFPEHEDAFRKNLERYLETLEIADRDIRESLSEVRDRKLITLHDAWYYFAVAYGFDIVGTFEPSPGRSPTPRYLAALSDAVEASGATALYSEPQIATQGIAPFARDHGLDIVELDPVGGIPGRMSFIELIEYNARIIRQHQE